MTGSMDIAAPIDPQWARILTISKGDFDESRAPGFDDDSSRYHIVNSKAGFTTVVAVKFGPDGLLSALELSDASGYPEPGTGKVVRVKHSGDIEEVVCRARVQNLQLCPLRGISP